MSNKFENTEKVLRVNDPEKKYWLTIIYFPKYTLCRKHNIFLLNRPSIHLTENRKKKVSRHESHCSIKEKFFSTKFTQCLMSFDIFSIMQNTKMKTESWY